MKTLLAGAAGVLAMCGAANAAIVTNTFDGPAPNTPVTTFDDGTVVTVANPGGHAPAIIFDTTDNNTSDNDLEDPFVRVGADPFGLGTILNNIVIIPENSPANQNDSGNGGTIEFIFDSVVTFFGLDLVDTGEDDVTVTLYGVDDMVITTVMSSLDLDTPNGGPSRVGFLAMNGMAGIANVARVVVDFGTNSGGLDNLVYDVEEIPVPAALPLLLTGLGGLGWASRRRRKTA